MSTGMSHSQTLMDLSSEVDTNLRFSSTKVIVFTAPKWRSYSWTISLDLQKRVVSSIIKKNIITSYVVCKES